LWGEPELFCLFDEVVTSDSGVTFQWTPLSSRCAMVNALQVIGEGVNLLLADLVLQRHEVEVLGDELELEALEVRDAGNLAELFEGSGVGRES
jgi:hypothetical protein